MCFCASTDEGDEEYASRRWKVCVRRKICVRLDDIEQRLAALDVAEPLAADSDESDESDSVAIVGARVPTTAMPASELVDPLLADHTCADTRQGYLARVQTEAGS